MWAVYGYDRRAMFLFSNQRERCKTLSCGCRDGPVYRILDNDSFCKKSPMLMQGGWHFGQKLASLIRLRSHHLFPSLTLLSFKNRSLIPSVVLSVIWP